MILSKKRITKALIRLLWRLGWYAPVLFENLQRQVFLRRGPSNVICFNDGNIIKTDKHIMLYNSSVLKHQQALWPATNVTTVSTCTCARCSLYSLFLSACNSRFLYSIVWSSGNNKALSPSFQPLNLGAWFVCRESYRYEIYIELIGWVCCQKE